MQYTIDYRNGRPVLCKGADVIARFEPLAWPDDIDAICEGANRIGELQDAEDELAATRNSLALAEEQIARLEGMLGDLQPEEALPA